MYVCCWLDWATGAAIGMVTLYGLSQQEHGSYQPTSTHSNVWPQIRTWHTGRVRLVDEVNAQQQAVIHDAMLGQKLWG